MRALTVALLAAAGVGGYWYFAKGEKNHPHPWPSVLTNDQAVSVDGLLRQYYVSEETSIPSVSGATGDVPTVVKGKLGTVAATSLYNRVSLALSQNLSVFIPHEVAEAARLGQKPADASIVVASVDRHPEVVAEAARQNWHLYRAPKQHSLSAPPAVETPAAPTTAPVAV